jgi:hypothetical protein
VSDALAYILTLSALLHNWLETTPFPMPCTPRRLHLLTRKYERLKQNKTMQHHMDLSEIRRFMSRNGCQKIAYLSLPALHTPI